MSRRSNYLPDPKRAPVQQPPLYYRDGRELSARERFNLPEPAPAPEAPPPFVLPKAPPVPMADRLLYLVVVLAAIGFTIALYALGAITAFAVALGMRLAKP